MLLSRIFADNLPTWALFLEIFISGGIVVAIAARLTVLADKLGDELNLGKAFVGMLLLAGITSLPEVVTGATAVLIKNPNMAFAAVFGSCSFNIILIVMINGVMGGGSVLGRAEASHKLTSSFGIILLSFALIGITLSAKFQDRSGFAQGCEWFICAAIAVCYIWFMKLTYRFERNGKTEVDLGAAALGPQTPGLKGKLVLLAVLLTVAAWWLTKTGDVLAAHRIEALGRPLGDSFVGAAFLALATSLPEVVTCLAAIKLGQLDLALGNIFGSNMFNMFAIPMLKIVAAASGLPLLMGGDFFDTAANTITGLLAILLTGIAVAGLTYRTKRRFLHIGFDSALLLFVYALGMYVVFSNNG